MINALRTYLASGLACLPVGQNKAPHGVSTWKGGITDEKLYSSAHGIGIICGKISGNLEVIDFDNHFGNAKNILSEFVKDEVKVIYDRYTLPIETTMNGGYHLLYRCDTIQGNQKLAQCPKLNDQQKWVPDTLIETRGEGGYIVSAPTEKYCIIRGDFSVIPTITPAERDILLQRARSFNTWNNTTIVLEESKDRPGDIFNSKPESVSEMISALCASGWGELRKGEWRRPGKKEGISATLGKVAENVFYVFSSNAYPFEPNKAYTPFQVISLLQYGGNFAEFAKKLSERYQLQPEKRPVDRDYKKPEKQTKTVLDLEDAINKALIDTSVPIAKPPVYMRIRSNDDFTPRDTRIFTAGNFSAITGKGKSKKTFLVKLLASAAVKNGIIDNKFICDMPLSKSGVLLFDTEQGEYDCYQTALSIQKKSGTDYSHFGAFSLREYTPLQRCDIIEFALERFKGQIGFVCIDGIADLATAINDEEEATRVGSLLLRWTKQYDLHINVVIHQNKSNDYATGHIGSMILKKAETVMAVQKDPNDKMKSIVTCDVIRGAAEFSDFAIYIDEDGMPHVTENFTVIEESSNKRANF